MDATRPDGTPGPPEPAGPSFLSLLETHAGLEALFFSHQAALLERDFPRARACLVEFERGLQRHARAEEELLLPVYARAGAIRGGAAALFTGEHRQMLAFVARFREAMETLDPEAPDLPRRLLDLLDQEAAFKRLVEHHDARERNLLYPTLDQVTTLAERQDLLRRIAVEESPQDRRTEPRA